MDAAFVTNMMTPYRLPLFEALHARLPGGIGVVALAEVEQNRDWVPWSETSFPLAVIARRPLRLGAERFLHVRPGTVRHLRRWDPTTVVVGGWDAPAYWAAAVEARRRGARLVGWVGTHDGTASSSRAATFVRTRFVQLVDGFLAYSARSAAYLVSLGASPDSITVIGNMVDTHAVAAAAQRFAASGEGRALRSSLTPPVFAYVGQLVARKNVEALFDALARARMGGTLLVLGGGPLEPALKGAAMASGVDARFLGPLPNARIHELLGIADCLVLPSREEVWGLVVNEALAAGVFCVVSRRSGAVELITDEMLGMAVEPSPPDLAAAIAAAAARLPLSAERRTAIVEAAFVTADVDVSARRIAKALG